MPVCRIFIVCVNFTSHIARFKATEWCDLNWCHAGNFNGTEIAIVSVNHPCKYGWIHLYRIAYSTDYIKTMRQIKTVCIFDVLQSIDLGALNASIKLRFRYHDMITPLVSSVIFEYCRTYTMAIKATQPHYSFQFSTYGKHIILHIFYKDIIASKQNNGVEYCTFVTIA